MSSKTKIVVIHMKEVIYTIVFIILAIILGLILFFMFGPGRQLHTSGEASGKYTAGIYRSAIQLNNNVCDIEVTVDTNQIQSIHLENLNETTETMFPLMKPALESLSSQIYSTQSLESLQYPEEQKYTSMVLIHAISDALAQAEGK